MSTARRSIAFAALQRATLIAGWALLVAGALLVAVLAHQHHCTKKAKPGQWRPNQGCIPSSDTRT